MKLRALAATHGVDYLFPAYFVWGMLIRNLADIGYDANNLVAETYDWRLGPEDLQARDGYFTRLKGTTETLVRVSECCDSD